MISDDVERRRFQILRVGELRRGGDQIAKEVDLVIAVDVLQHRGQTLQAHSRIDAGLRQRRELPVSVAIELHEHQVPDLDVTVALRLRRPGRAARDPRAVVVEDLTAGTAGPGLGHLPEVVGGVRRALVVADAHDALARHADVARPRVVGLVVGVIDRDPQAIGRQLVDRRQQLPRKADRLALEVIAERPVARASRRRCGGAPCSRRSRDRCACRRREGSAARRQLEDAAALPCPGRHP